MSKKKDIEEIRALRSRRAKLERVRSVSKRKKAGEKTLRKTGIDILGDVPWGTHFCLFYHTSQDLIDILVPYFEAGLKNNEFCMWVTSEPLNAEDAKRLLKQAVGNLDGYIKKGQIEILDYRDWYTKTGVLETDKVLQGWVQKHDQAIKNGFDGLRLTGNTFWLEKKDWKKFADYEAVVNSVIGKYKMLAVCTYSLERCGASEILDVEHNHQFALIKWKGDWKILESSTSNQLEARLAEQAMISEVLGRSRKEWVETFNAISDWVVLMNLTGRILRTNRIGEEFTGVPLDEIVWQSCCKLVHGSEKRLPGCPLLKMLETGQRATAELQVPGTNRWLMVTVDPVTDEEGNILAAVHITRDITERKRAEVVKKLSNRLLEIANRHTRKIALLKELVGEIQDFTGCAAVGIRMLDEQGNIPYEAYVGFSREFYESESPLSTKTDKCMCINVIKRDTDPEQPFYTKGGSFYMNGTTKFLATVSEEDKGQTRNVCNEVGYESVALVPIRVDNSIIGLIHIADTQENMAPLHMVEALEYVAVHLGTAILRVCAEEALRESEAELFTVLNNVPSVLIVVDRDRRVHRLNKSAAEFGRRTAEEMIGLRGGEALRCLHSLDDPKGCGYGPFCEICVVRNTVLETFKTGKSFYQREAQLPFDIDGKIEELALLVSTTTVEISGDTMVLVCLENITKRKRTEEQIENLAKFPSENPYPVVRIAADGTVLYANQVSNTLLAERKSGAGQLCPSDWRGMVSDVLKSGSVKRIEVRHKGRTFAFRIVPVQDANYVNFYGTDITERKRAEEALKIRAEILENMVEGVNVSDDNGIIFFTNPKFDSMFGYEPGELTGQNVSILNALSEEENAKLVNGIIGRLRAKGGWRGELTNRRKDGTQFFTHAKISQLYMSGKNHWISVQEDITERKQAEKKLLDYQAQLKSLASELTLTEERERRRIAADLHDQISQSLASTKIELDALRHCVSPKDPDKALKEVSDSIGEAINDMRSLTFDLSFPVLYELGFEAAVAEWLTERIEERHRIATEFEDDGQPKPLDEDVRVFLFRDVRELLMNVVKHANANKVKVSVWRADNRIHVSVEDDGVGFDVAKVVSTSAKAGGFGLFSIRERLEELGGHLEIDSKPGHGTRVTLMAPLKRQNAEGRQK